MGIFSVIKEFLATKSDGTTEGLMSHVDSATSVGRLDINRNVRHAAQSDRGVSDVMSHETISWGREICAAPVRRVNSFNVDTKGRPMTDYSTQTPDFFD